MFVRVEDHIDSVSILADGVHIQLSKPFYVCEILADFLACYFAWDLSYPKQYQILTFLHLHLLEDTKEHLFRSVALIKFEKLFQQA